jgi:acyl-CoA thioester hydrolase
MTDEIRYHALFRVSMRHIDFFGHVHNSVYLDYCQDAVVEFLQKKDLYAEFSHREGAATYLVKKIEVTFQRPLQVEDTVGAEVSVTRVGGSSLTFEIRLDQAKDRLACAVGQIIWVCVDRRTGRPRPIPSETLVNLNALLA